MGLGGVGSFAAEALARSGVCKFSLTDFDKITESNINRQIPANYNSIGRFKAQAMADRIKTINPQAKIKVLNDFCDMESRQHLLENSDFIIDAIDSLGPKTGLMEDAFRKERKIISVMGAAGKTDPSKITQADLSQTKICPLARRVRKFLRRRGIEKGIPVIYSTEKPMKQLPHNSGTESEWFVDRGRKRGTLGSIVYIPAIMGMRAAAFVIRSIIQR